MYNGKTQLVPKPQKCAKIRKKAQKSDFVAVKGAPMTPFGEFGKKQCFYFYFLNFIFIKSMRKVFFFS